MSIGTNIKELRRKSNITQEYLADLLHLTSSAISQWETDRVLPDITYLPKLASIFNVSSDIILGIDIERKKEQINEIYRQVRELWCTGQREQAKEMCRECLVKFPDSYLIMEELAFNLSYSSDRKDMEESISLFERILAGSNDECTKNFAIGNLCDLYMSIGKEDRAKEIVESMPKLCYTKDQCHRMTLHGAEWAYDMRKQIAKEFDSFVWELRNLLNASKSNKSLFTEEEIFSLWQKLILFVETFYENGDYGFQAQLLIEAHYKLALFYLKKGATESALDEIEIMADHIVKYEEYSSGLYGDDVIIPPQKRHTSLLVRPSGEDDPDIHCTISTPTTENAAMEYLHKLSNNIFDPIRNDTRFLSLEKRLCIIAHE